MKNILVSLVISAISVACGNATKNVTSSVTASNETHHGAPSEGFETLLTCDDGAATIEVATADKSIVNLVIHNPRISGYLTYWPRDSAWAMRLGTQRGFDFDNAFGPKLVDQPKRFIHNASDITYFTENSGIYSEPTLSSYRSIGTLRSIYRQYEGLKIEELKLESTGCTGQMKPYNYSRDGVVYHTSRCDGDLYTRLSSVKNWFFQKCDAVHRIQ